MDHLVRLLSPTELVLDLGAGDGSFCYASTNARVLELDVTFPDSPQNSWARVLADSRAIPLKEGMVDVVICNHTLEHFEDYREAIQEIDRVLRPGGFLWVAVPDGYTLDDHLYRFVFQGGGHVNRFTLPHLVESIESDTRLRARSYKKLYTGFVFLNPPDPYRLLHYPKRARILAWFPPRLLRWLLCWLNFMVRLMDRCLGSNLSQYGWAMVYKREQNFSMPSSDLTHLRVEEGHSNVCFACGAGHPFETLSGFRILLFNFYDCPSCGTRNLLFSDKTSARKV